MLVSAIANPHRFRRTAEELGWTVARHHIFPDHHSLTNEELEKIMNQAGELPIVVTEKDWVKLPAWFKQKEQASILRIETVVDEEAAFWDALLPLVSSPRV